MARPPKEMRTLSRLRNRNARSTLKEVLRLMQLFKIMKTTFQLSSLYNSNIPMFCKKVGKFSIETLKDNGHNVDIVSRRPVIRNCHLFKSVNQKFVI